MKQLPTDLLQAAKAIKNAMSVKEIASIVTGVGKSPSMQLTSQLKAEKKQKIYKFFLAIMAGLLIITQTHFSYIGGWLYF